uniref:GST C-terminal domain-containing protein n=1 Tax=Amorphochlora amoebiformis TaxID=1561963 RepID=A0A7S0CP74_9EUKA
MVEVSLYGAGGKPDWFWKLNPKGEVPVIQTLDGSVVADSEQTLDYIADNFAKDMRGMSKEDMRLITAWRTCINNKLKPIGKRVVCGSERLDSLHKVLQELEELVVTPCVVGHQFTVADASAIPFFQRLEKEYELLKDYPRLSKWYKHTSSLEGVKSTFRSSWWWWW